MTIPIFQWSERSILYIYVSNDSPQKSDAHKSHPSQNLRSWHSYHRLSQAAQKSKEPFTEHLTGVSLKVGKGVSVSVLFPLWLVPSFGYRTFHFIISFFVHVLQKVIEACTWIFIFINLWPEKENWSWNTVRILSVCFF